MPGWKSQALAPPRPHAVPGSGAPEVHGLDLEVEGNPEGVAGRLEAPALPPMKGGFLLERRGKKHLHACRTSRETLGTRLTPLSSALLWPNCESLVALVETPFTRRQCGACYVEAMGRGDCCYSHGFGFGFDFFNLDWL